VGNVSLLPDPLKICESEIYILFKDRVLLCNMDDFTSVPLTLANGHIFGSMISSESVFFYSADSISRRHRKEGREKKDFSDIFQKFMAISSLNKEALTPLASFAPSRMFELVQEYCVSILAKSGDSMQSMLVQAQLKDKSSRIALMFRFLREVEQYINVSDKVMCLPLKFTEELNFASLVRSELQKNDPNINLFLSNIFWMMQNKTSTLPDLDQPKTASHESFFQDISHVSDILPSMIKYERQTMSLPSSFPILCDAITSACYFFDLLLQKDSKMECNNNFGYVPISALPSTRCLLKEQVELVQEFFVLLKRSHHVAQVKNNETYDRLYGSALSIVKLILSGYVFECQMSPNQQELLSEFRAASKTYIDFFVLLGKTNSAIKIAKNFKIFDSLIALSSEKDLVSYRKKFADDPEFNQTLYNHFKKVGNITELLEDPVFYQYYDDNTIRSLHLMSVEDFESSYPLYVNLSLEEKNLSEKKRLVAIRKLIAWRLGQDKTRDEDQLLQMIKMQDPSYLESLPDLKQFQDFLFQYHPKGIYIEPTVMMYTLLENKTRLFFEDFVTLFHVFTYSTKLRNQPQDVTSVLMCSVWTKCLLSTSWNELKYDLVSSDSQGPSKEIRKTLLFRVATHAKISMYFVQEVVNDLLKTNSADLRIAYIKDTIAYIQRYNLNAQQAKRDEKRLDQLFYDEMFKSEPKDNSLIFPSLLKPVDLTSMPSHKPPVKTNSLFNMQKSKVNQAQKSLSGNSAQPPVPSMKRILSVANTLPITLGSLKASKLEPLDKDEEKNNASVNETPIFKIKQEQNENIPVPQSPLKLTASTLESSDLKKNRQPFSLNSPNKYEFSLSDALSELGIVVDERTLGPFDGDVPDEVDTYSVKDHLISLESEYSDFMEEFDNYFEKKQTSSTRKTLTKSPMPVRHERIENTPKSPVMSPMKSPMPNRNERRSMERSPMQSPMANRLKK
jgi:hypothetical protein